MTEPQRAPQTLAEQERDLFRHLLELGRHEKPEPFLAEALALIVAASEAQRGYLELYDEREGPREGSLWAVHGCTQDEIPAFRGGISQGVIAAALTSRATVRSASALADPRFRDRGSVRRHQIQAVLCAPIIAGGNQGVIYLQGRRSPGPFSEDDRARVETFARHVAALADRLLLRRRFVHRDDPTLTPRRVLQAPELIGRSAALAHVLREAALAVPVAASVLITGATGTGKTILARAIHRSGPRAARPFVECDCAALPEGLFERDLFGAVDDGEQHPGKIAAAEGGVLFLDEIGEMLPSAQARLVQLLQSGEYYPLGSAIPVRADVRVIAATNADLSALRPDLHYRLNALTLRMPSLSERADDIAALVVDACRRACETYHLAQLGVSPGALVSAETSDWPGNVRQLYHAVEAAVLRARGEDAPQIEPRHLFPERPASASSPQTYQEATRHFQRSFVQRTLEDVAWNISEAARRLDVGRTYLYRLIATLGVERS